MAEPEQIADAVETCPDREAHCETWCSRVRDSCPEPDKRLVEITALHAEALSELVNWFKMMIALGFLPLEPGRSDELTIGDCDELLQDLEEGD